MLIGAIFGLVACGSSSDNSNGGGEPEAGLATDVQSAEVESSTDVQSAIDAPSSTLSQALKDAITHMYNEEGLAHDVYLNIYKVQAVKQLQNIATNSEVKHIEAVNQLAIKYDLNITKYPETDEPYSIDGIGNGLYSVPAVQALYNTLYAKGIKSKKDALEVGCMVEVVDINDLNEYIELAEGSNAADVLEVFHFLRNGSYTHYWAFDEGLKNMDVTDGCCSLGGDYCHPEYPKKN